MPPSRRRQPNQTLYVTIEDNSLCSPFLTRQFWEMAKEQKRQYECPICYVDIMRCCDGGCFALRTCGHVTCLRCYVSQQQASDGEVQCPICKQ